ncbi:MAG: hypothetical protein CVU61_15775 [Deltaproteobacteria bacterium HGW-Deltaproteobacteria-19]|jgi:PAS domain S-box-containing protein|nr:MAG: hypothetical protein CVU61_15775 [Deltaproteobacteria bacterium HGW-Deltaproteobacteria-19]
MSGELRILILEDVATDAELMVDKLRDSGLDFTALHVSTPKGFLDALASFSPNLILSDYALPSFDGLSALRLTREKGIDVPFLFVSGAVGEERAVELLRQGATDYVLKDRLSRLGHAVSRALQEAEERRECARIERALQESEANYRTIFENTGTATLIVEDYGTILLVNRQFEHLSGYPKVDIENKMTWTDIVHPEDLEKARERRQADRTDTEGRIPNWEFRVIDRQGDIRDIMARMAAIPSTPRVVISLLDITHLRRAEQKILATNEMLRSLTSELVMTEERERRRIAVELHDHIAQTLALAKMEMDALSHRAAGSGMEASCGRISDMLRQSIQETRSLIREISPSVLYELGLNEAVLWLADQFQSKHGLDVNVADGLGNEELEQDLQVLLFRTVRELLMNVVKHARAGKAWVTLEQVADNIAVSVRDDGSGFHMSGSSQDEQEMGGFGLFSIRERVRHLGGRLIIESAEGKGTRVRLEVPKRNRT